MISTQFLKNITTNHFEGEGPDFDDGDYDEFDNDDDDDGNDGSPIELYTKTTDLDFIVRIVRRIIEIVHRRWLAHGTRLVC